MSAPDDSENIVGKYALAIRLGWTRDRLDRRIANDRKFPVLSRGGAAGQRWQFDLAAVRAHLASIDDARDGAGISTRDRLELARADAAELKTRVASGELVRLGPLGDALTQMFVDAGKSLDDLPGQIASHFGLQEESQLIIRELVDSKRREMVAAMEIYLPDEEPAR